MTTRGYLGTPRACATFPLVTVERVYRTVTPILITYVSLIDNLEINLFLRI